LLLDELLERGRVEHRHVLLGHAVRGVPIVFIAVARPLRPVVEFVANRIGIDEEALLLARRDDCTPADGAGRAR
jgi:hypothetical protein